MKNHIRQKLVDKVEIRGKTNDDVSFALYLDRNGKRISTDIVSAESVKEEYIDKRKAAYLLRDASEFIFLNGGDSEMENGNYSIEFFVRDKSVKKIQGMYDGKKNSAFAKYIDMCIHI